MDTISTPVDAILQGGLRQAAREGPRRHTRHHFTRNVVLHCPQDCGNQLGPVLASFILDGVRQVHLAGPDGGRIKKLIDSILTRGEFDVVLAIVWYEGETLDSVAAFARGYCHQFAGGTQVVHL